MSYYPKLKERKYYCPNCKAWYIPSEFISCRVYHSPGDCCHEYETKVEDDGFK